jgi:hypothetical protein
LAATRGADSLALRSTIHAFGQYRTWPPEAIMQAMERDRATSGEVHVLACTECPRVSSVTARGWEAHRIDDPFTSERPALAFYCPDCARRVFGRRER